MEEYIKKVLINKFFRPFLLMVEYQLQINSIQSKNYI